MGMVTHGLDIHLVWKNEAEVHRMRREGEPDTPHFNLGERIS